MKKVLRFLGNLLITLVLILAIVMTIAVVTSSRSSRVQLPNLFGYALLSVQSDSMESDSGFFTGDLIVDKILTEEEANQLSVGDVISFIRSMDGQEYLETHRIVSCEIDPSVPRDEIVDGVWQRGSTRYYVTMGDNTPGVDKFNGGFDVEYTSYVKIYGIWTGIRIPKLGTAMDFLQSSMGFMICVVLPVALFFIYQLYIFIVTLTRRQKEKALEEVSSKEEELKQKAIAEFLATQQANDGQTADPDTKPAASETPDPPASPASSAEPAEPAAPATEETPESAASPANAAEPAKPAESATPATEETPAPAEEPKSAEEASAPADGSPAVSEEEKERIIREYLAKQAQEKKPEE